MLIWLLSVWTERVMSQILVPWVTLGATLPHRLGYWYQLKYLERCYSVWFSVFMCMTYLTLLRLCEHSVFAVLNTHVLVCLPVGVIFLIWFYIKQKNLHMAEFLNISDNRETIRTYDNFHVYLKTNPAFDNAVEICGCHLPSIVTTSLPYKNDNKCLLPS